MTAGDECADAIGEITDLGCAPALAQAVNKRRCKRISRTNGVGDFDCIAGYFGAVVAELNRAALLAVRDAKGLDVQLAEPFVRLGRVPARSA